MAISPVVQKIFFAPASGKARHSCYNFGKVYVRVSVCPDCKSNIYAWISNLFGTVVVLEEDKCHLKQFLGRLKVRVTLEGHVN